MSRDWLEHHQIGLYFVAVAIAAVAGLASEGVADLAAMAITPAIAVLMYAMFLQIPFLELRQAFANRRFVGALLLANFVLVPLLVWLLTLPLSTNKALLVGALLVLLTPCIDYVVVFTHLGKGDSRLVLAATPLLLLLQLLMLPVYLKLMLGTQVDTVIAIRPFAEAFLLLIVAPLVLAVATELGARRSAAVRAWSAGWAWLPVPAMAMVLVAVIGSQIAAVARQLEVLAPLLPVYAMFMLLAPALGAFSARLFRLAAPAARAVAFSSSTRNSLVVLPLALALPEPIRGLAAAAVITQTLVELVGELIYLRTIPALVRGN
jgi:ACR3 family arsenite efflux pump ArsB